MNLGRELKTIACLFVQVFKLQLTLEKTLHGLRDGRMLWSSRCYFFTLDNPLYLYVSAYLPGKLGVVLIMTLPDTVTVEINW